MPNIWRYLRWAVRHLWRQNMWPTISCYRPLLTINGYRPQRGIYLPHKRNRSGRSCHGHGGLWHKGWGQAEVWVLLTRWSWGVSDAGLLRVASDYATRHSGHSGSGGDNVYRNRPGGILP